MKKSSTVTPTHTMVIGDNRYYWDTDLNQWKPESYKFEKTK